MIISPAHPSPPDRSITASRRGIFVVIGLVCLTMCLTFVAFSVDVGYLTLEKTRMQNAVDAAALAAAQEIVHAVENAPPELNGADITAYSIQQARAKAVEVAQLNGVYVDGNADVEFGLRSYDPATDTFSFEWGVTPANCVRVTARRTEDDPSLPDGKLPLFFAGVTGDKYAKTKADAVAFVEARDLVVIHDFSRSMNFDSYYNNEASSQLSRDQTANYALMVWDDLGLALGTLPRIPEYLTLTNAQSGVSTSVEFRYNTAVVTTDGNLTQVRLDYTGGGYDVWTNVIQGTGSYTGSGNISRITVTSEATGAEESISSDGITVQFSADRRSYTVTSDYRRLIYVDSYFETGGASYHDMPSNTYSYSVTEQDPVDYAHIRSRYGNNSKWIKFNPTNITITQVFDDNNSNVKQAFAMDRTPWPYPSGSWDGYIDHCRTFSTLADNDNSPNDTDFRERYGGLTFANYILKHHSGRWQCPDLWKTRHYPFHSIKEGHELLCNFLADLRFDDQIGMVSYDTSHRIEMILNENDPNIPQVDISSDPITSDYAALNNLMKYKQAAHYSYATNMAGGLKDGIALIDGHRRDGARATLVLMTDGNSNTLDSNQPTSLPSGWDWNTLLDYDGDGYRDYYTSDPQKTAVLRLAKEAVDKGYTIHTMSVGVDADRDLLRAVAFLAKGTYIEIPGGTSVSEMEAQVRDAFHKIATLVPPARLANDSDLQ